MKFSLSLLCVLSLQIPVFAETLATTTPVNRFERKSWETRHNEKIAHAKEGNIDLILLGDSITEAWERQRIYPKCFEPYTVLNLGFGGDRTQHALWRIQHGELDGISPSFVSIMLGTNNISHDEPADIAKGVEAVVRGLRKRLPETKIILLSVFPRNHPRVKGDTEEVKELNSYLPALADNKMVFHYDFSDLFLTEDGDLNPACFGNDMLHMRDLAYEKWAKALNDVLAKYSVD